MGSLVVQLVKNLPAVQETWVGSLGQEDPLEKGMATHSSIIAWKVLLTEEPGGPQSMGSQELDTTQLLNHQGVRNTLAGKFFTSSVTWEALFFFFNETQVQSLRKEDSLEEKMASPSIVFAWGIPRTEEPGYSLWDCKEWDTTEQACTCFQHPKCIDHSFTQ